MKDDVYLAGYSVAQFNEQKLKMTMEAVAIVAENIKEAVEIAKDICKSEIVEYVERRAREATNLLKQARTLAGDFNVLYEFPDYIDGNDWDSGGGITGAIKYEGNSFIKEVAKQSSHLRELLELAESMEDDSDSWNSSSSYY